MALIKIELQAPPIDGMDIKFKAPCNCSAITGLLVTYPEGSQEFTFRDCHGNNVAGIGGLFAEGAYVKVIVDVERGRAYLQNADNNSFLNSAIFGTYTHSGNSLTGNGENGKFKATASGTISAINVNGVSCSVKCGEESSMDLIAGCWYTFILDGNTVNFNAGGAGGGLNFAVVKNPQPASPKDNTIWVDTDVDITGYDFVATAPSTPVNGMVWFVTGASSSAPFNALKKNGITVYPLSAKQYINGAWVYKESKMYQNGVWVDVIPDNYLFYEGYGAVVPLYTEQQRNSTVTVTSDKITTTMPTTDTGYYLTSCVSQDKISVTKYNLLKVEAKVTRLAGTVNSSSAKHDMRVVLTNNQGAEANAQPASCPASLALTVSARKVYALDISSFTGSYFCGVVGTASAEIYNMWLEE